jgi:hypothetical protein
MPPVRGNGLVVEEPLALMISSPIALDIGLAAAEAPDMGLLIMSSSII